jgi:hypothetical protein
MATETNYNELLEQVLKRVIANNEQIKPGTPLAELKEAIEESIKNLPPLEFEEFNRAVSDMDSAAETLIRRAPEIIGWNADQIVEWIEALAKKV